MEIAPGIHQIDRVRVANSYLVTGPRLIVIDTGLPGNAGHIARYIQDLGRDLKDLEWIVLTHADIDHTGSAARLREMSGAKIAIHTDDAPMLSGQSPMKKMHGVAAVFLKAMTRVWRFRPFPPDVLLKEGDVIGDLKVLHTPGHTPGSICLYRSGAALFAGDTVRTDSEGNPRFPPARMSLNQQQVEESVARIAGLEFDILLPGHGRPITAQAARRVRERLRK